MLILYVNFEETSSENSCFFFNILAQFVAINKMNSIHNSNIKPNTHTSVIDYNNYHLLNNIALENQHPQ